MAMDTGREDYNYLPCPTLHHKLVIYKASIGTNRYLGNQNLWIETCYNKHSGRAMLI